MLGTVSQRRWGYRTRFEFGEHGFEFEINEPEGLSRFSVAYETVALDRTSFIVEKNFRWFRRGYFVFLGVVVAMQSRDGTVQAIGLAVGVALAVVLLLYEMSDLFDVGITQIPNGTVPSKSICVLDDHQHSLIMAELGDRRRGRLRALLGTLDLGGDLNQERAKFDWLLANEAISADEHAAAVRRIELAELPVAGPSTDRLN
jgi:hypothetical protein